METKKCTKCGRELPLSEFGKYNRTKDGLQYHCKQCVNESERNRYGRVDRKLRLRGPIGGGEERTPNQIMDEIKKDADILRGIGMEVIIEINYKKTIKL